jgi:ABC-2 type transport system permease protein
MSRYLVIAKHEYLTNITRLEFILLTLGLPLLGLVVAATAALPALLMARTVPTHLTVGVVDETGLFDFPEKIAGMKLPGPAARFTPPQTGYTLRHYATRKAAVAGLRRKVVSAYLVIPKDYVKTGEVLTESARATGPFAGQSLPPFRSTLVRGLLKDRVEREIVDRVLDPVNVRRVATGPGKPKRSGPLADMGRFLVPYGFTVLMMMSIFAASGYLLRGISDEKEGRIIEIVLSSVSAQDLFLGKLLGLSAVGLTQVFVWLAMGVVPATAMLTFLDIPAAAVLLAPLFFLLGFLLYGTIIAGIGALGGSWRESQQLSGGVSMLVILPVMFFPVLLEAPNGGLSVVLSLFPFSAPIVMMIRLSATSVPWWQVVLSVALLTGCIWVAIRLSVRLFRTAMLMYGKRPSVREAWRWMRAT